MATRQPHLCAVIRPACSGNPRRNELQLLYLSVANTPALGGWLNF